MSVGFGHACEILGMQLGVWGVQAGRGGWEGGLLWRLFGLVAFWTGM